MGLMGLMGISAECSQEFSEEGYEKSSLAAFVDCNRASDPDLRRRANARLRYTVAGTDLRVANSGPSDNRVADHRKGGQGRSGRTHSPWLLQIEDHRRA